jgi:ribosomal protein S18 acetylase RimI-like enzyme
MQISWLGAGDEERFREIRLRALADAPKAFASTYEQESAFAPDVWTRRLTDDDMVHLLAEDDGRVLGMTAARREEDGTAHVLGMWVAPEARGRGVGRRLLDTVTGWARDQSLHELALWVAEPNTAARTLYERYGFRPTGERQPLPSDVTIMERRLVRSTL